MEPGRRGEDVACSLIGSILGVRVAVFDDGSSSSMPDLTWTLANSRVAVCEVSTLTRPDVEADLRAWRKHDQGLVGADELSRLWTVEASPGAAQKKLAVSLVPLFVALEANGFEEFDSYDTQRPDSPDALRAAVARGVIIATSVPTASPGLLVVFGSGGSSGGPEEVPRAIERSLREKPDNAAKLLAWPDAAERHIFYTVTEHETGPAWAMTWGTLPRTKPALPDGIDAVWMAVHKDYTWRWTLDEGWSELLRSGATRPLRGSETRSPSFG